uniref:Uncharacterized protein n=2 Tax=Bombyx mori TaxID=7091 RepID=A0A8R2G8P1_BOMMO|nr:uncharacterized protein LOC105842013 isoform X2 [Bombyx mori]
MSAKKKKKMNSLLILLFIHATLATNVTKLQEKILNDLSWNVKLKLLNEYPSSKPSGGSPVLRNAISDALMKKQGPNVIDRRVGIAALIQRRQDEGTQHPDPESDENTMRLKLFRLMYETVRDSDMKANKAVQIRQQYQNSTPFEVGYLIGDITDKYNVMIDIAATLKRLYREWKPLEHINAYEQIASQAIEISHLIDMAKYVSKRKQRL